MYNILNGAKYKNHCSIDWRTIFHLSHLFALHHLFPVNLNQNMSIKMKSEIR